MNDWPRAAAPALDGVVAAVGPALCCAGPLLAVTLWIATGLAALLATLPAWQGLVL